LFQLQIKLVSMNMTLFVKQIVVVKFMKFYAFFGCTIVNCQHKMYCRRIIVIKTHFFSKNTDMHAACTKNKK